MDKELYNYFLSLGFEEGEVDDLCMLCPGLEIVDGDKAFECIRILVRKGYPKEDLSSLLAFNPSILMYEPRDLEIQLDSLNGDIEEILKSDPNII